MPPAALLLALALPAAACEPAYVESERTSARVMAAVGKTEEALRRLVSVSAACASDAPARLKLAGDIAALRLSRGDPKGCREAIEGAVAGPGRLSAAEKALAAVYYACGCPDVRQPLCREGSWLKKGYAEVPGFRLNFDFSEEEKLSAAGTPYTAYYAVPSSLEVLDGAGKAAQKMPIRIGEVESGPTVERNLVPKREEKDNIRIADMNFDGRPDVAIAAACGNGRCCTGNHWLRSPATGKFEYSEALAGICFAEFDAKKREVRGSYHSSAEEEVRETYRWEGAKLRLIDRR